MTPETAVTSSVIPLSVPEIRGNEWAYVKECLDTGWVSSVGPFVTRFERELASYVGAPHAVALVSGTAALHIGLKLIGVQPEEEVLVSDLTFIAPVNAIRYCQAHPVFVDADLRSWQMDTKKLERFLFRECEMKAGICLNKKTGRRVRAVLPVHILGLACEMDRIVELARRFGLGVVEDAAEGIGVRYQGRHVGTFGDVGIFSFNGNKVVTAGGGGMIVTHSKSIAEKARYLTTQAKDDDLEYIHNEVGYNYRLTNIQAALGVAQLEQLDSFLARKRAIAQAYAEAFRDFKGITLMPSPERTQPTWWLYTFLLREGTALKERKGILRQLQEAGIGARPLWHPIHRLPPYRDCQGVELEVSDRLYERGISLPSSVGLGQQDLDRCIAAVRQVVG